MTDPSEKPFDRKRKRANRKRAKIRSESSNAIKVRYNPLPKQKEFADMIASGKRVVLFLGGIRGGKTYAGAYEALKQVYKYGKNPPLGWVVSPTYPMSLIAQRAFEEAAGDLIMQRLKGERAFLLYPNKNSQKPFRVEFKSADEPDRLRGVGLAFIWIDEAAMIDEEAFRILLGRVLDTKGVIFMTTTPMGHNWVYHKVYRVALENPQYGVVKSSTLDNTYLDAEDVKALKAEYSEEFAKQELEAEFINFEGLVYKSFNYKLHTFEPWKQLPKGAEVVAGIDFGLDDPFAYLWMAKHDGKFFVLDEYYQRGCTMQTHASYLRDKRRAKWEPFVRRRWADPRGAQERMEFDMMGIQTSAARSTANELLPGINAVGRAFESGRLFISKSCLNLIKELGQYHWNKRDGKNSQDKPVDYANHALDALRYCIFSEIMTSPVHPYYSTQEDGTLLEHAPVDYNSNRLEDWFRMPTLPVFDPNGIGDATEEEEEAFYDSY